MRWDLVAGPASGGYDLALTKAQGRKYTARLTDQSELSFAINGEHPQAAAVDELTTDVHLLCDGTPLDRCRVAGTGDTLDGTSHQVSYTCLDYKAVLGRRLLLTGDSLIYSADQAEIAWSLVQVTQAKSGGSLGIVRGWSGTLPTGVLLDRTFVAGDSIGELIQTLSETDDGFDWDLTPTDSNSLSLNVWHTQRGTDRGVVLIYGGDLIASLSRSVDPSNYANSVRLTGSDAVVAEERVASDIGTVAQGRWDLALGESGITTQSALSDRADWQIGQSQVITPAWTVTMRRGAWEGPSHIWLGDPVRLVVMSGRLSVDTTYRVQEASIDLDGNGGEQVTLTLGAPRVDYRRRARLTERRLRNLERR